MKTSSIYQYLESKGLLENGSPEDIAQAKKEYWRMRRNELRREKRKREQQFTVSYTKAEMKIIEQEAGKRNISRTRYIRQAALAKLSMPNINSIKELLYLNYKALTTLQGQGAIPKETTNLLVSRIHRLEKAVLYLLTHPKSIENDS